MTAATADRLATSRSGDLLNLPVKAAAVGFQGAMIASLAGVLVAARAAVSRAELDTLRVLGIARTPFTGGAADGDIRGELLTGVFRLANSAGGEALTLADIDNLCFAADDLTVAKTTGGGARPIAGRIVDVDAVGVWVQLGPVGRGPRRIYLPYFINETDTLAGTSAELVSPVAGAISNHQVIVQKAITTGGDVTVNVGATPVVGLTNTIADAAAKGAVVTDQPTIGDATTIVAVGSRIQIVPAAAFATAGAISGLLEITY
jgi:hypothetical protein